MYKQDCMQQDCMLDKHQSMQTAIELMLRPLPLLLAALEARPPGGIDANSPSRECVHHTHTSHAWTHADVSHPSHSLSKSCLRGKEEEEEEKEEEEEVPVGAQARIVPKLQLHKVIVFEALVYEALVCETRSDCISVTCV